MQDVQIKLPPNYFNCNLDQLIRAQENELNWFLLHADFVASRQVQGHCK